MKCSKCLHEIEDKLIHCHHLLPYEIFKTYDCPTIPLCQKHHSELHAQLEAMGYTTKLMVLAFTAYWLEGKEWMYQKEQLFPLCPKCKNTDNYLYLFQVGLNYLTLYCPICGFRIEKDYNSFILWERKVLREYSLGNKKIFFKGRGKKDGDTETIAE